MLSRRRTAPFAVGHMMFMAIMMLILIGSIGFQLQSREPGVVMGQLQSSQYNIMPYLGNLSVSQTGGFRLPAQTRLDYYDNPQLATERQTLMYPYNHMDLTDISSGKPIHDQPLQFRLPFFGFSYEYIWLQRDGYITFNKGMQTYRFPLSLPIQPTDTFVQEDPSMMAPFFAMQDVAPETPGAGVYFRIVNLADPMGYYNPDYGLLRDRILLDFREGMIGASDFVPKYAMIVTWANMTIANRRTERRLKTNTYQAVIATDEIRTYTMFNYEQIEWITHMDNYDGLKGPAAFVGFNAGNTTRSFEFKPYSQHQRVSLLPSGGFGNNIRGRYYFQVDEEVWPGACIDKKLEPNLRDRLPLTFFPRYGHMLGGTLVDVTGPCLDPNSIIFCKFDNLKAEAVWRDTNRATCISPPFMYHGYTDLTISVDDRIEFVGRFYIQPPDIAEEDVIVIDAKDRQEDPQELELKWHPQKLSWRNDTSVTISLWGYRETMNVYPQLTYITTLVQSARLGQSSFRMDLSMFRDRDDPDHLDITFGFIAVNLTNPSAALGRNMRQSPVIWSRPMPLAWYFKPQWLRTIGYNYKDYFCNNWFERESFADRFAATVWRCPCTLKQVQIDKGRFSPDLQCNIIDRRCETFHREALHCVQTGRPSIGGSGQTCCYDDQGELIQTADTIFGGRPSRAFPYGKHPFKIRMMIPTLSTWVHDVAPYFYCCLWQHKKDNAESCQNYNAYRTSQDCSLYQPPVVGSVYGDPHLITFNKNNYTFNGRGEYVLVHTDDPKVKFDVQARFEQVPKQFRNLPNIPATQLTAVAAQDNFSSVVEFRIRPLAARWRYHIYVLVDNEYIFWWDRSMQVQNFRGVTLYQPAGIQNMSHIIAMFDSGAGVEVMSIDGYMTTHVYLPSDFQGITGGLLGNYSRRGLQIDDLVTPTGMRYGPRMPIDRLHRDFGQQWRLTEANRLGVGKTIFSHNALRYAMYDHPNFEPVFQMPPMLPPELMHLQPEMDSICSDSLSCIYDYVVSYGNKELALATKKFEALAYDIANVASLPIIRCPALPKPANGMKSENRYWPGQVVRFSCDQGYRLVGYEARFCRQDGLWSWGEDPQCIPEWRYFLIMFGSIMAAFLPMAVTIAAGVFCLLFMVRRSRAHYTGEQGEQGALGFREKAPSNASLTNRSRRTLDENADDDDDQDDLDAFNRQVRARRGVGKDDDDEGSEDDDDLVGYNEGAPRAAPEMVELPEEDEDDEEDEEDDNVRLGERETDGMRRVARRPGPPVDERSKFLMTGRQRQQQQQPDDQLPIGSRSLFDTRPPTVYSPTTSTSPGRFGPALFRPFQASGSQAQSPPSQSTARQRQQQQASGLPQRPPKVSSSRASDSDYGPLREARI
uniref:Extracellular domains-containing protein CG31004 n=1 Tax=Aceria tosichella TaxID=561515 RepID=A0A6G1S5F6_9ACAR